MTSKERKVIITDDDLLTRHILKSVLEELGVLPDQILLTSSAAEYYKLLESQKGSPEIIILDLFLKDGQEQGLSLLRNISSNPQTSNIPILIFTSDTRPRITEVCLENGASSVIIKDSNAIARLSDEIKRILGI